MDIAQVRIVPKKLEAAQKPEIPQSLGTNRIIALTQHDCRKSTTPHCMKQGWRDLRLAQIGASQDWGLKNTKIAQFGGQFGRHITRIIRADIRRRIFCFKITPALKNTHFGWGNLNDFR